DRTVTGVQTCALPIFTSRGGMTSHAAVVCRGMGTPCVAGAEGINVSEQKKQVTVTVNGKTITLNEGDWISLDGSTGEVFEGKARSEERRVGKEWRTRW